MRNPFGSDRVKALPEDLKTRCRSVSMIFFTLLKGIIVHAFANWS